jgi:hypothetical protein
LADVFSPIAVKGYPRLECGPPYFVCCIALTSLSPLIGFVTRNYETGVDHSRGTMFARRLIIKGRSFLKSL